MNDNWRARHAKAHERYSQLKDRIDRAEGGRREWEQMQRELDVAEAELKALDRDRAGAAQDAH